jgi:hypothetical protein
MYSSHGTSGTNCDNSPMVIGLYRAVTLRRASRGMEICTNRVKSYFLGGRKRIRTYVGQLDLEFHGFGQFLPGAFLVGAEKSGQSDLILQIRFDVFVRQTFEQVLASGHPQGSLIQL